MKARWEEDDVRPPHFNCRCVPLNGLVPVRCVFVDGPYCGAHFYAKRDRPLIAELVMEDEHYANVYQLDAMSTLELVEDAGALSPLARNAAPRYRFAGQRALEEIST